MGLRLLLQNTEQKAKTPLIVSNRICGGERSTSFWPKANANPTEVGAIATVIVVVKAPGHPNVTHGVVTQSNLKHNKKNSLQGVTTTWMLISQYEDNCLLLDHLIDGNYKG